MTKRDNSGKATKANPATKTTGPAESLPRLAYSMAETAQVLGVSYMTVHRLLKQKQLRACGGLRNKVIPKGEIARFLAESVTPA